LKSGCIKQRTVMGWYLVKKNAKDENKEQKRYSAVEDVIGRARRALGMERGTGKGGTHKCSKVTYKRSGKYMRKSRGG